MNVFVIPSWYPQPDRGLHGGVFLAEAVDAIARHHAELMLSVSLWGQGDLELSSARLRAWLARPHGPKRASDPRRQVRANLVEYRRPAWTWRYAFRRGNLDGVLRRNRENLAQARAEHGTIHLLHAHVSYPAGTVALALSRDTGIPFVVTEHMSPFPFRHFVRGDRVVPEVREPLEQAHAVTAVSRSLAREIGERVGRAAVVIPNGVDEAWFTPPPSPPERVREGRGSDPFTFLTIANLTPQKGVDVLLEAIARLGSTVPTRFRIGGVGSHATTYRAAAGRLGVRDRVDWLGALDRESVRDELRACDAFVLPSRHESFGVVIAEALACGKPVLATRCGGPEDLVDDANGELVTAGDVVALTAALDRFRRRARPYDPVAIRAGFEQRFTSRAVADRFVQLYRQIAAPS